MRGGLSAAEFAQLAKRAYAAAAAAEVMAGGRKVNYSRVAVLTGLTRREVRALLENPTKPLEVYEFQRQRGNRVRSGWHEDPEFLDRKGKPAPLPLDGPKASFRALVKRYSGDVTPVALLAELERVKAVKKRRDGRVQVLARSYVAAGLDSASVTHFAELLRDLGASLERNMAGESPRRFVQTATSLALPTEMLPLFRRMVAERGQQFLEMIDQWLQAEERSSRKGAPAKPGEPPTVRTGVGLFHFEDAQAAIPNPERPARRRARRLLRSS
jgi:hypothetical protein